MNRLYHQGVEWDKWEECDNTFTLISDRDYIAVFNFGKQNILIYQLICKKRNYSVVGTYDRKTIGNILRDWQYGKVYITLKL
tara:strand:- start:753 stop:998 length:246 start_codon:yes stop_codon:yes gene_type:complete